MGREIIIEDFVPTSGAVPSSGVDGTTGIYFTEWELSDEGTFAFRVPADYTVGSEIVLKIQESTASSTVTDEHQWQASVLLVEPSVDTTAAGSGTAFTSGDLAAASTANLLQNRQFNITSSGQIDSTDVYPNDLISVALSRIAVSDGNEDSNAIRLMMISISFTVGVTSATCSGRVGVILNDVRTQFPEEETGAQKVSNTEIIRYMNRFMADMADRNLFRTTHELSILADTESYNLTDEISDYVSFRMAYWTDSHIELINLAPLTQYRDYNYMAQTGTTPLFYLLEGDTIWITPIPTAAITETLTIEYNYLPADLTCDTNYTPPWPKKFDSVCMAYCLWQAFLKNHNAYDAKDMIPYWEGRYNKELFKYMAKSRGSMRIRP